MAWLAELALLLIRALHLLVLAVAPTWLSPEPLPPPALALAGSLSAAALAAALGLSAWFAAHLETRLARNGAALLWLAIAVSLAAALYYRGPRAPLAQGAALVGVPLWAALATLAAAAAEHWLGSSFKHRRMGAAVAVVGLGSVQLLGAASLLGSPERMWWEALRRDGAHLRAVDELTRPLLDRSKPDELEGAAARCLKMHPLAAPAAAAAPATCACLALRAEARLRARKADAALRDAEAAHARCPEQKGARAALAEALAVAGRAERAEAEARAALAEGGDPSRLRYALALALERAGRLAEAREEAERAIAAGAGRQAQLLAGALAILAGDLEGATARLAPLVKQDPADAEALYNLALIADKRGDYNGARQGYLAALKADPRNADARYNVALLTFRAGVVEESRHHVRKFLDGFPEDPRGGQLAQATGTPLGAAAGGGALPSRSGAPRVPRAPEAPDASRRSAPQDAAASSGAR
ncbi:tetratricopeptide repeat protein [Sorangium sp. So ce131]|uniref:tetratricopeptide repeat protein n=1 Tax=Sorangium sp. So ce131 TaxID=3133282 RepID=UPI003F604F75